MNDTHLQHGRGKEQALLTEAHVTAHLTEDQFADLLVEPAPAEVAAHLAACAGCAEEAQRFSSAIAAFEQESRLWAERRSAAHAIPDYAHAPASAWTPSSWLGSAPAGIQVAASAILVLALGIALSAHRSSRQPVETAAVTAPATLSSSARATAQPGQPAQTVQTAQAAVAARPLAAAPVAPAPVTPATLKADNELLSEVDGELSSGDSISSSPYGLEAGSQGVSAPGGRVSN